MPLVPTIDKDKARARGKMMDIMWRGVDADPLKLATAFNWPRIIKLEASGMTGEWQIITYIANVKVSDQTRTFAAADAITLYSSSSFTPAWSGQRVEVYVKHVGAGAWVNNFYYLKVDYLDPIYTDREGEAPPLNVNADSGTGTTNLTRLLEFFLPAPFPWRQPNVLSSVAGFQSELPTVNL